MAAAATVFVLGQIALGAWIRHGEAPAVIPTLLHVLGAIGVFMFITVLALKIFNHLPDEKRLVRPAAGLVILLLAQVGLGIYNLASKAGGGVSMRTIHLAFGALILATCLHLTIWSHRLLAPRTSSRPAAVRMQGVSA